MGQLIDEFDFYDYVLHHGNRQDFDDYGEWGSWEADWPSRKDTVHTVLVRAYDDDRERKFLVTWEEIHE